MKEIQLQRVAPADIEARSMEIIQSELERLQLFLQTLVVVQELLP